MTVGALAFPDRIGLRNRGGCINQIDDVVMLNRNFLRCKLVDDFSGNLLVHVLLFFQERKFAIRIWVLWLGFAQQVELDFVESASYLAVGSD